MDEKRHSGSKADSLRRTLDNEKRWRAVLSAAGSITLTGHDWDEDAAAWVRAQRRSDPRRIG